MMYLFLSGARTPIFALLVTVLFSLLIRPRRSGSIFAVNLIAGVAIVYFLYPHLFLSRGLSYRPAIWWVAIEKALDNPIWGYGVGSTVLFKVEKFPTSWSDTHNYHLAVLLYTGLVGFILWIGALYQSFKKCFSLRFKSSAAMTMTMLFYGVIASSTDGGGLMSRPKEMWFLTWVPLSFAAACDFEAVKSKLG
jgi:O-antigen ligase